MKLFTVLHFLDEQFENNEKNDSENNLQLMCQKI